MHTQAAFAALIGVDQSTWAKYESGNRRLSLGAMKRVRELAEKRGVKLDPEWLFAVPVDRPRLRKVA